MTTTNYGPAVEGAYRRARYWQDLAVAAERAGRRGDALAYAANASDCSSTARRWSVTA